MNVRLIYSLNFVGVFFSTSNLTNLNHAYSYYITISPNKSHYVYELMLNNEVYSVFLGGNRKCLVIPDGKPTFSARVWLCPPLPRFYQEAGISTRNL